MICKIRLRAIYRSNPEVRAFCGMIAALALLPGNDVSLGLENLKEIADEMPLRTIPLLEYVERVYVGSEGSPARFPWYRLITSDIGLGLSSHPRQWHWLTINSGCEMSALIIFLPKSAVRKFSDEFSKYILQKDEFSKCVFQWGRVFFRTSFPYTHIALGLLRW